MKKLILALSLISIQACASEASMGGWEKDGPSAPGHWGGLGPMGQNGGNEECSSGWRDCRMVSDGPTTPPGYPYSRD
jgi:hypothetical protein